MTIHEAIVLQSELLNLLSEVGFNKYKASTQLGIEALKKVRLMHKGGYYEPLKLLPGETKE